MDEEYETADDLIDALETGDDPAGKIAASIYRDISGRSGIGDELGGIDEDIQIDMIKGWVEGITTILSAADA